MQDQEDKQDQQDQENEQNQLNQFDSQTKENNDNVGRFPEEQEGSEDHQDESGSGDLHDMYDRHENQNDNGSQGASDEVDNGSDDIALDDSDNHDDQSDQPQVEHHEEGRDSDEEQSTTSVNENDPIDGQDHEDGEQPAGETTGKKILLVEDDEALAAVYRSRLELEGFEIHEVHNGEEALQAAKDVQPDLLLLDAMMPKISGFDVLDILRHTPETANIRVIMLTALSQPKDKEKAEALGVDDYLVKSQVVIGDVVERAKHHLGMTS